MSLTVLAITFSLLCAGWVKGVFGMGLPAVSLGLLGLFMPPVEAATLILIPTIATNAWQFAIAPRPAAVASRFSLLLAGVTVGTALGIGVLTGANAALVSMVLGTVLILYAIVGLFSSRLEVPAHAQGWMSPLVGFVTGILNGATGVSVMPLVPYLNSVGLHRDELIQALGLIFLVAVLSLAACLAWTGHLRLASAGMSALALLPVFAGMYAGQFLRQRLQAQTYREWFFFGLIALGGYTLIRSVVQWLH